MEKEQWVYILVEKMLVLFNFQFCFLFYAGSESYLQLSDYKNSDQF